MQFRNLFTKAHIEYVIGCTNDDENDDVIIFIGQNKPRNKSTGAAGAIVRDTARGSRGDTTSGPRLGGRRAGVWLARVRTQMKKILS
jgi:hypothetical protein